MSEAWREVARLGKSGEAYPHILADSHGWCLKVGPRERLDERYYSSLPSLLQGLSEQVLRRTVGWSDEVRTLEGLRSEIGYHLRQVASLGTELERKLAAPARLRPEERRNGACRGPGSASGSPAPETLAPAPERSPEAA